MEKEEVIVKGISVKALVAVLHAAGLEAEECSGCGHTTVKPVIVGSDEDRKALCGFCVDVVEAAQLEG